MFEKTIPFRAKHSADRPAIWHQGIELNYARFNADIDAIAFALSRERWPAKSTVLIDLGVPSQNWLFALALERLGHTFVVGSSRADPNLLLNVRPPIVITDNPQIINAAAPVVFRPDRAWMRNSLTERSETPFARSADAPNDVIAIVLSSGTTGPRKKIALTRSMIDARLGDCALLYPTAARRMSAFGMGTIGGLIGSLAKWHSGQTVILFSGFDGDFLQASRPDLVVMSPNNLDRTLTVLPNAFAAQPKIEVHLSGSAVPPLLVRRLEARGGAELHIIYGSTECGVVAFAPFASMRRHPGGVGYVSPMAQIKVVGPDGGRVPLGEPGEVLTRAGGMVTHYLDDPASTARNFTDGWFRTGDIGRLMSDGLLIIDGRADDILNIGGNKVSANVVEHAALELPGVLDAGVTFFEEAGGGTRLCCAVVTDGHVDERAMAEQLAHQFPVRLGVMQVPAIPRNEMGKVQRDRLLTLVTRKGAPISRPAP